MASGYGVNAPMGRCYPIFLSLSECAASSKNRDACDELRDDYAVVAQLYRSGERTDFRTGRPAAYPDTASTLEGGFDALTEDAALLLSTESARLDFTASSRTAWGEPAFVPAERWDLVLWIRTVSPTDLRR